MPAAGMRRARNAHRLSRYHVRWGHGVVESAQGGGGGEMQRRALKWYAAGHKYWWWYGEANRLARHKPCSRQQVMLAIIDPAPRSDGRAGDEC